MLGFTSRTLPVVFEEKAPHERGFAAHFERTIAPGLRRLELLRRGVLVAFAIVLAVGLPVAAAVAYWAFTEDLRLLKLAIILGAITVGLALVPIAFFTGREQRLMLPALCEHIGDLAVRIKPRATAAIIAPFRALELVPPLPPPAFAWRKPRETVAIDDLFMGNHRGIGLLMAELEDVYKRSGQETRLFRGTLIAFGLPERAGGYAACRVRAPDPNDLARLEVTADGAAAALVSPAVLESLGALVRAFAPAGFRAALDGNVLRIAMALKGRSRPFDVGNPFLPVYRCEPALRAALAQLAAVRDVMEALAVAARDA